MPAGDVIADRFELFERIAQGGAGVVWRARDHQRGDAVALKLMVPEDHEHDRFLREARVLAELTHPAIVRYRGHGVLGTGERYIATEWLEGEPVSSRLERGTLAVADALAIAHRVAEAMAVAHGAGIVHRDLKPDNVLLVAGDPASATLLDFGVAHVMGSSQGLTLDDTVLGTPGFMAPEQVRGETPDARTDVFGLGCLLYACLTGGSPFVGEHPLAALARVLLDQPVPLRELRHDIPPRVSVLVERMLRKSAAERPLDGNEAAALIRGCVAHLPLDTRIPPPMPGQAGRAALGPSERRHASIVLARIIGAPEPGLIGRLPTRLRSPGASQGVVEWLADGSCVALFAAEGAEPRAQTLAACRFALDLKSHLPAAQVVVGSEQRVVDGASPLREIMDRTASVLDGADPDHVSIDVLTANLLAEHAHVESGDGGLHLIALGGASAGLTIPAGLPFVGRVEELRLLAAHLRAVVAERSCRAIVISGPAGSGKSRLCTEFLLAPRAHALRVVRGRAEPLRQATSGALLRSLLCSGLGIRDQATLAEARTALASWSASRLGEVQRDWLLDSASELWSGTEAGTPAGGESDAGSKTVRLTAALQLWLRGEFAAADGAIVLSLEDVHWSDDLSLGVLDALLAAARDTPLLLLATARPERPPVALAAHPGATLSLSPLSDQEAAELAQSGMGRGVTEAQLARVLSCAQGSPFFLEQLIRSSRDGGASEFPPTVQAATQARLARLPSAERRVLRAASILGEVFERSALQALLNIEASDLATILPRLAGADVLRRRTDGSYRFAHALLRDAAYTMLTAEDRVLGHRLAAAWLEARDAGQAAPIARHHELGGQRKAAERWWAMAARHAHGLGDHVLVRHCVERALENGATGAVVSELLLLSALAEGNLGDTREASRLAREALRRSAPGSRPYFSAWVLAISMEIRLRDPETVRDDLGRCLDALELARPSEVPAYRALNLATNLFYTDLAAERERLMVVAQRGDLLSDPKARAFLAATKAEAARREGAAATYLQHVRAAEAALEEAGEPDMLALARVHLAGAYLGLGDVGTARDLVDDAVATLDSLQVASLLRIARGMEARILTEVGEFEAAKVLLRQAGQDAESAGDRNQMVYLRAQLAHTLLSSGEYAACVELALPLVEVHQNRNPADLPRLLSVIALAKARGGEPQEGLRLSLQALQALSDISRETAVEVRLAHAECLAAAAKGRAARQAIRVARQELLTRAEEIADPAQCHGFLHGVALHVRVLALAAQWQDEL